MGKLPSGRQPVGVGIDGSIGSLDGGPDRIRNVDQPGSNRDESKSGMGRDCGGSHQRVDNSTMGLECFPVRLSAGVDRSPGCRPDCRHRGLLYKGTGLGETMGRNRTVCKKRLGTVC